MYIGPNKLPGKTDNNCEGKKNKDTNGRSVFTLNLAKQDEIKILAQDILEFLVFYHIDFFKLNRCF